MPPPSQSTIINYVRCALNALKLHHQLCGFILWGAHKSLDHHLKYLLKFQWGKIFWVKAIGKENLANKLQLVSVHANYILVYL